MKALIIGSICSAIALPSIAQTPKERSVLHKELIVQADAASNAGDYKKAVPLYEAALKLVNWDLDPYFDATLAALQSGREDKANEFLLNGVENGFDPMVFIDSSFTHFLGSEASKPFRDGRGEASRKFASHADSAIIKQIEAMIVVDQEGGREDSLITKRNDSLNFDELLKLCKEKGFPVARTTGVASNEVWLLLWHHRGAEYPDSPQWKRIIPYIDQAIDAGEMDPSILFGFDDFSNGEKGIPMKYGMLLGYYRNFPEKLYLADRAQVNANRASVGMGTIEKAAATSGIDLSKVRFAAP